MSFERIVIRLIDTIEQGYTEDAGGPTKYGISLNANPDLTVEQIKNLTKEEAVERYREREWSGIRGESLVQLSERLASIVFDFAVNSGVRRAVRYLQLSLVNQGFGLKVDGLMGPATLQATENADKTRLIYIILTKRAVFMSNCGNWERNKKGWLKRLFYVGIC